ncbi:MAG: response regulator, partial [Thermodesulfovibrionales bacterium]
MIPVKDIILVVEDKDSMAAMINRTLSAEGYEVVLANNGDDAVKAFIQGRFDLVLTDLKLPGRDGL